MFCDARMHAEELKASLTRVSTLMRRRCTEWDARTRPPPLGVAAHRAAMLGNLRPWVWWWRWWRRHLLTKVLQVGHVVHGHTPAPLMALAARDREWTRLAAGGPRNWTRLADPICVAQVFCLRRGCSINAHPAVCNNSLQQQSGLVSVIHGGIPAISSTMCWPDCNLTQRPARCGRQSGTQIVHLARYMGCNLFLLCQ